MMIVISPSYHGYCHHCTLLVLYLAGIGKNLVDLFKEQQVELGKLNSHMEETIRGIQVVKAFKPWKKWLKNLTLLMESYMKLD